MSTPSHDHQSTSQVNPWTPPKNRLPFRPFSDTEAQTASAAPHSFYSRPFFDPSTQPGASPDIQAQPDPERRRQLDEKFDLTKIDLFAGAKTPSAPPPMGVVQRQLTVNQADTEAEIEEESNEGVEESLQRQCADCAAEDGDGDGDEDKPPIQAELAKSWIQRQDTGELQSAEEANNANIGETIPSTHAIEREEDPNQPVLEEYRGASVNKIGRVSAPAGQYEIARDLGVNIRARPDGTLPHTDQVLYNTRVMVQALDNTDAFYFIIADTGEEGWINRNFVAVDPPDIGAEIHHVTEDNLTTILQNEYVTTGRWALSTGNDYTTLAAAIAVANQEREGVSVDWNRFDQYRQNNRLREEFDPTSDNFATYHAVIILRGSNIWLPSSDYVRTLQDSGAIGSRSALLNTAIDIGNGITGFHAGVVAGVFGTLWDTITGLWDLVKSVLDGSLFSALQSLYEAITTMTWEDLQSLAAEFTEIFNNFEQQWNQPDTYQKWHFRGSIVGAIALEVILAFCTGGLSMGSRVLASIGRYLPRLRQVLGQLSDIAGDLHRLGRRSDNVTRSPRGRATPTQPQGEQTSGLSVVERPSMDVRVVDSPNGDVRIYGQTRSSSRTPGHDTTIEAQAERLARSGEYEHITMQRSWGTATGRVGNSRRIPDIIAVRRDGRVDAFEVQSRTDDPDQLLDRLTQGMRSLPGDRQGNINVIEPEN